MAERQAGTHRPHYGALGGGISAHATVAGIWKVRTAAATLAARAGSIPALTKIWASCSIVAAAFRAVLHADAALALLTALGPGHAQSIGRAATARKRRNRKAIRIV